MDKHEFITRAKYKAALENLKEFRRSVDVFVSALERSILAEPIERDEYWYCSGCGEKVKKVRWQFCPICGQRFRDTWGEMTAKEKGHGDENQTR